MPATVCAVACTAFSLSLSPRRVGTIEYVLAAMDFDIFMKIANEARA